MDLSKESCSAVVVQNECLQLGSIPIPKPSKGEVLIRVKAAGVNHADIAQRKGKYPPPEGASPILGLEVAGTIEQRGPNVTEFQVGDNVMALVSGGGYAEFCVAQAATTLPLPEPLTFAEAAAIPEAYFTIWANVFDLGALRSLETILIHGGTSGIGSTAIQLARASGATVIATARSDEKCSVCLELGAHHAINYTSNDFDAEVRKITDQSGVDLIFDWIGEKYFEKHVSLLKRNGRLVLIACLTGRSGKLDLGRLVVKNLSVLGSVLRGRPLAEKAIIAKNVQDKLIPLINDAEIKPLIYQVMPFTKAQQAHSIMEASTHIGKLILVPDMP